MSDPSGGAPSLLVFTLVHGGAPATKRLSEAGEQRRAQLFDALSRSTALRSATRLAVVPDPAADVWSGGSVDVIAYASDEDVLAGLRLVSALTLGRTPIPRLSTHAFGARKITVKPPVTGANLFQFSMGAVVPGKSRSEWQRHWLGTHAKLIDAAPVFMEQLNGYSQYHLLDPSLTGEAGTAEVHGIAQMNWTSFENMTSAYALPDYRAVLRTDEDNLIFKGRGTRIFARPVELLG